MPDPEQGREQPGLAPILFTLAIVERWQDEIVGQQGRLHQRRVNPSQRRDLIGAVGGARRVTACRRRQHSRHRAVTPMQPAGRGQRRIDRAEHHRENRVERSVETANRIGESPGMLGDPGGDPGVRQLKQQSAAGAKEHGRLAVDPPGQ